MGLKKSNGNGRVPEQSDWEALSRDLCKLRAREHALTSQVVKIRRESTDSGKRDKATAPLRAELDELAVEIRMLETATSIMGAEIRARMPAPAVSAAMQVRIDAVTPPPARHRGGSTEAQQAARRHYNELLREHVIVKATQGAHAALKLEPELERAKMVEHALSGALNLPAYAPGWTRAQYQELREELGLK